MNVGQLRAKLAEYDEHTIVMGYTAEGVPQSITGVEDDESDSKDLAPIIVYITMEES